MVVVVVIVVVIVIVQASTCQCAGGWMENGLGTPKGEMAISIFIRVTPSYVGSW